MLSEHDFVKDTGREQYVLEDDLVRIEIDENLFCDQLIIYADQIRQAYPQKVQDIARQFAADELFSQIYGCPAAESIPERLGKPVVRLFEKQCGIVTYTAHTFDDVHILDIEISGIMDEFFYVSIDG